GDLSIDKAGIYTLAATANGFAATSDQFTITPDAATALRFTVQPSNAAAGTTITPQVEVTAYDAHDNIATGFTGSVTIAIATNPAGGTLSGTTEIAAVNGVATFSTLSLNNAGIDYTLSATSGSLTPATSASFEITAGAASRLAFTVQPPAATTAGATLSPALGVTARDSLDNPVTTFVGTVTLTITANTNTSGATLSGTRQVDAVAGVATFGDLSIDKVGTGYTLSATANGLAGTMSALFNITPGAPSRLVFTVQPSPTTAGAPIAPPVQVTVQDALGNTATDFTSGVDIAIGTNPAGGTLTGTTTVNAVAGVASFSDLRIDKAALNPYTLVAAAGGLSSATSTAFTITADVATALMFTVQPSNAAAGATIAPQVEVTALDAHGNVATGFGSNVIVAFGANPGGGTLSGTTEVAAVNGIATFSTLSIDKAATGYRLTATATGPTAATSAFFDITAGAATRLVFTGQPSTATPLATIDPAVLVTARDAFDNLATGFAGNVTVAIGFNPAGGSLSGTQTFAAIGGVATFPTLRINSVGTYTLTATAASLAAATSDTFDIITSTATQLFFTVQPGGAAHSATAGATITPAVQVTVRDASGQTVTTFNGDVTLTITAGPSGANLSGTTTVPAAGGIATFSDLSIDKTGTGYKLTATSAGLPAVASAFFTVTAGPAAQLAFNVQPSTATALTTITPQVEVIVRDALDNRVTGFTGNVTVAITPGTGTAGATLSGTTTVAAVQGIASFSTLSIDSAGAGYQLTATAAGLPDTTSTPFNVTATLATQLVFTVQPTSTIAGATISPAVQVTARDASGLTDASFTGDVTLTIRAGTGTSGATLSGTRTVAAVNGVATFPTLSIDRSGTGYKLSATGTGVAGSTSSSFTINPGAASQLSFTVQPDSTAAGALITPAVQVTVKDALGNPVKTFGGTVTVTIQTNAGGGTLSGTTTVAAPSGVATFSDLSIDKAATGYGLEATSASLTSASSDLFSITAGAATQLVFSVQPSNVAAGAIISPNVRVTAMDALGNVARAFTGVMTVAIETGAPGALLSGTTDVTAGNGVAIFSDLSIDLVGTGYTLRVTAPGLPAVVSTLFNVF
ncbi:MAG TPA: hypothetical protein VFU41_05475, partial [Gemmatimonadales bacterium]|nr:hypothetical protein [Gemmatimonadales bacterium]